MHSNFEWKYWFQKRKQITVNLRGKFNINSKQFVAFYQIQCSIFWNTIERANNTNRPHTKNKSWNHWPNELTYAVHVDTDTQQLSLKPFMIEIVARMLRLTFCNALHWYDCFTYTQRANNWRTPKKNPRWWCTVEVCFPKCEFIEFNCHPLISSRFIILDISNIQFVFSLCVSVVDCAKQIKQNNIKVWSSCFSTRFRHKQKLHDFSGSPVFHGWAMRLHLFCIIRAKWHYSHQFMLMSIWSISKCINLNWIWLSYQVK